MMHYIHKWNFCRIKIFTGIILGGLISTLATPVKAADIFSNNGIQFDVDTVIEFEFVESHGAYQSTFGVINLDTGEKTPLLAEVKPSDNYQETNRPSTYRNPNDPQAVRDPNDFLGTPGNAVSQPLAEFEFKANNRYVFYLESSYKGKPSGIVYSQDSKNLGNNQQVLFEGGLPGLTSGGTFLRWDDTGSVLVLTNKEDRDYNDFMVRAGGHLACPYKKDATTQERVQQSNFLSNQHISQSKSPQKSCRPPV